MKLLLFTYLLVAFCCASQAQILDKSWRELVQKDDVSWFGSMEAKQVAENVLLLQKDIGGWPKNVQPQRLSEGDKRKFQTEKQDPKGATIDNGATTQEMVFLAKVYERTKEEKYRTAFIKGLDYLLAAQYESGGWSQYSPVRKGYYSHITYNDDAMVNVLHLLKDVAFSNRFEAIRLSAEKVIQAKNAFEKGIDCILATQYVQNGRLTAWCAQHDKNTMLPAKARSYELPSLSGSESAKITLLLMEIEHPAPGIKTAVEAAVNWLETTKIEGLRVERYITENGIKEKRVVNDSSAGHLWARFMVLDDNTPFFSDRDGIKKYTLSEIGQERRNGYKWYTDEPQEVLRNYPQWKKKKEDQNVPEKKMDIYNLVVAKDGSGDFTTIQAAINAAKGFPDIRVTIQIKNGVYKEKVEVYEWNNRLNLIGEDREKTIITYDDYFDKLDLGRNSTFHTPTLLVQGNDFYAANLTIENTAGEVGQAVALAVNANRVLIENCRIKGNQDTLYTTGEGFKQFYKDCYIEGTTDFIFGQATALFQNCEIHSKSESYITAASTPKEMDFGYVFKDCKLTGEEGLAKVYLGRPWRTYAKTVFINCHMNDHIIPEGWDNWDNEKAEKEAFYAEYDCDGKGYRPGQRVPWSHQLTKTEAQKYTVQNILDDGNIDEQEWYNQFEK